MPLIPCLEQTDLKEYCLGEELETEFKTGMYYYYVAEIGALYDTVES